MSEQPLSERMRSFTNADVWADEVEQLEASEKTLKQINDTQSAYINELKAEVERLRDGISKVIVESMSKETSIAWLRIMLNDIMEPADE